MKKIVKVAAVAALVAAASSASAFWGPWNNGYGNNGWGNNGWSDAMSDFLGDCSGDFDFGMNASARGNVWLCASCTD